MNYYAIIVAGGSGKRMANAVAKQFLLLKNLPIMMHTICAFHNSAYKPQIIVVLPEELHVYWEELCVQHQFQIAHQVVTGGEQRFHSVRNGLMAIKGDGIIAVHDAVRPLVSQKLIDTCFEKAVVNGNSVACIQPSDSVREIEDGGSKIVDRSKLVLIQTPQTFQISQLRIAYQQSYKELFTDDASVVEQAGFYINLVDGERHNFKITYPEDLELANLLVK